MWVIERSTIRKYWERK